jgi:prevent-host-death family protein
MRDADPTIETMKSSEARKRWDEILEAVRRRERRVIVEKDGKPVAALVSIRDLQRLDWYEAQHATDFAILDEIGKKFADVPADEIEREVAKAVSEVREENRRRQADSAPKT